MLVVSYRKLNSIVQQEHVLLTSKLPHFQLKCGYGQRSSACERLQDRPILFGINQTIQDLLKRKLPVQFLWFFVGIFELCKVAVLAITETCIFFVFPSLLKKSSPT